MFENVIQTHVGQLIIKISKFRETENFFGKLVIICFILNAVLAPKIKQKQKSYNKNDVTPQRDIIVFTRFMTGLSIFRVIMGQLIKYP